MKPRGLERLDQSRDFESGSDCSGTGRYFDGDDDDESVRLLVLFLVLAIASSRGLLLCRTCLTSLYTQHSSLCKVIFGPILEVGEDPFRLCEGSD